MNASLAVALALTIPILLILGGLAYRNWRHERRKELEASADGSG